MRLHSDAFRYLMYKFARLNLGFSFDYFLYMEFLVLIAFAGYIYYLRNYADLRSKAEKEVVKMEEGIRLFQDGKTVDACTYFDSRIKEQRKSPIAHLYRARCYLTLENFEAAAADLKAGLSYDDSVFELHLDTAKLNFHFKNYESALISINKAIAKSGGTNAECYHWRGLIYEKLNQFSEAKQDFDTENIILDDYLKQTSSPIKVAPPLFDKRLLANFILTFFTTGLLLWIIRKADSIHLPYLLAVIASMSLGFAEPKKGWILALVQGSLLWIAYTFLAQVPQSGAKQELENFSLYGSIILTFVGSFLGAFLKRALDGPVNT
jgi:tetratricopeptide (TPR) repeat protein